MIPRFVCSHGELDLVFMFPDKFLLDKKSLFIEKKENSVFVELIQLFRLGFFSFHLLTEKEFFLFICQL